MKRECLLSRAYTGGNMTFNGTEIYFSALANDVLREFKNGILHNAEDQTDLSGISEIVMVMDLLARNEMKEIQSLRKLSREDRHSKVLDFTIEHEPEIERLKTDIVDRLQSTIAAAVESDAPGKPHLQAQDS
jgi:hypothetical protein